MMIAFSPKSLPLKSNSDILVGYYKKQIDNTAMIINQITTHAKIQK